MGERAEVREEKTCPIPKVSSAVTQSSPRTVLEHEGSGCLLCIRYQRFAEINSACVFLKA